MKKELKEPIPSAIEEPTRCGGAAAKDDRATELYVYIVIGLGMPTRTLPESPDITAPAQRACARIGMELNKVSLVGGNFVLHAEDAERWILRFPKGRRDDNRAAIVADRLRCIESVNGMLWDQIRLLPVREELISVHRELDVARVAKDTATENDDLPDPSDCRQELGFVMRRGPEHDLFLWSSLSALEDEKTERAASFLHESHTRAWFANAERWDMAKRGPACCETPCLPSGVARLESAVVSAFKAVEALIGTTAPDLVERKLIRNRFRHAMLMPFPPYRSLGEELSRLAKARDARAAHGSGSRKSAVDYYEVMGWQTCAQQLVNQALLRGNSVRLDFIATLAARRSAVELELQAK
jgi:hypothetical protein